MELPVFSRFDEEMLRAFADAGRTSQLVPFNANVFSVRSVADKELRRYAPVVSMRGGNIAGAVCNFTEFQRGKNAVAILLDPQGRIGMVELYRPVTRWGCHEEYVRLWDETRSDPVTFVDKVVKLLGQSSLEFPQGYSEMFEAALLTACREGGEEGRHRVLGAEYLGQAATDPANRVDTVQIFLVKVDPTQPAAEEADPLEMLSGKPTLWLTEKEFLIFVSSGHIFNALTLSAYAMLRAHGIWS